jgi:hypothetical protein
VPKQSSIHYTATTKSNQYFTTPYHDEFSEESLTSTEKISFTSDEIESETLSIISRENPEFQFIVGKINDNHNSNDRKKNRTKKLARSLNDNKNYAIEENKLLKRDKFLSSSLSIRDILKDNKNYAIEENKILEENTSLPSSPSIRILINSDSRLSSYENTKEFYCSNNSTYSLTYYYFELHVLLFHIAILACSTFIQLYFYFKLGMMLIGILIYIIGFHLHGIYECLFATIYASESLAKNENLIFLKIELILQLVFYVIFLHIIDRRVI